RQVDMVLDRFAVELVGAGIGQHAAEQPLALLIRELLDALCARTVALHDEHHHAAVLAVHDETLRVRTERVGRCAGRLICSLTAHELPRAVQNLLCRDGSQRHDQRGQHKEHETAHTLSPHLSMRALHNQRPPHYRVRAGYYSLVADASAAIATGTSADIPRQL